MEPRSGYIMQWGPPTHRISWKSESCLLVFLSSESTPSVSVLGSKMFVSLSVRCVPPLKIWQVPACKMDLIWPTQLGFRVWHSQLSLYLLLFAYYCYQVSEIHRTLKNYGVESEVSPNFEYDIIPDCFM